MNGMRIIFAAAAASVLMLSSLPGKERIVLRTEFQDIMPKFISLGGGRCTGISYELMEMLRRRTGIDFRFMESPVPLTRVVMNL